MKPTYRPEIDGLRAIAVSAVILFHAQITIFNYQPFKGGFIGVDIFFVISGYLITSIILKELAATGSFSFKYFYERRIRRILPILLVVMLVSLPFAWIFLLPGSFIEFSKTILYSLGFSSNFYFHYTGQEYSSESGLFIPFLHTWSLSVEEQYYILFPIILIITFKYFKKYLIHILILGFIISISLSDWGSRNHPSLNFYILPTRGWELIAGSILAYFEITIGQRSKNKTLNLMLPSIGLILIIHSIIFFNDKMFHPSLYTLSPIIGVCLIIWFSDKDELITKLLSSKLFVGVGLISYSLYLWHYPVFTFSRILNFFQGDIYNKVSIFLIILILSVISYYLIEKPSRNKKNKFKLIISIISIIFFILIIFSFNIIFKNGYKNRVPEILQKSGLVKNEKLLNEFDGKVCHNNIDQCYFNTSSKKKIYIIGDSHMATIMFNLKDRVVEKQYQFITSTFNSCLYFPGFNSVNTITSKIDEFCNNEYFQKLKKILINEKDSIIILGGRFPLYLSNYKFDNKEGGIEGGKRGSQFISLGKYDSLKSSFNSEVLELSNSNKIILIYPIPEVGLDPNKKFFTQWTKKRFAKNFDFKSITTSYKVYKDRTKTSFELLNSIQGDNIYRVFPHKLFCNISIKDRCVTNDDKNIFYGDDNHPSLEGVKIINDLVIDEIKKIELKLPN